MSCYLVPGLPPTPRGPVTLLRQGGARGRKEQAWAEAASRLAGSRASMGNVSRAPAQPTPMPGGSGLWAGVPTGGDGWLGSLSSAGPPQAPLFPQGPCQETGPGLVLGFASPDQERQRLLARQRGTGLSCKLWGPCTPPLPQLQSLSPSSKTLEPRALPMDGDGCCHVVLPLGSSPGPPLPLVSQPPLAGRGQE